MAVKGETRSAKKVKLVEMLYDSDVQNVSFDNV